MRVFTCVFVLFCALAASALPGASHAASMSPRRVITVSVLNDETAPVRSEQINAVTDTVFAEYQRELNIQFQIIETLPYRGDLTLFPLDQAFLLQRLHARGEIRLVFSNRTGRENDSYLTDTETANMLAGSSHPYYGHAIIYNAEARADKTDAAGHPALVTALKHEIAHLFGVEHSNDRRSFMYTPSSRSQGEWTEEVIEQIDEQRGRHWFPNA